MTKAIRLVDIKEANSDVKGWKLEHKQGSYFHIFINWFLAITKINNNYMRGFWTTIGSTIAVPSLRDHAHLLTDDLELHEVSLLFHEIQHIRQWRKSIWYPIRYLLSKRALVAYEIEAYAFQLLSIHLTSTHYHATIYINEVEDHLVDGYGVKREMAKDAGRTLHNILADFEDPETSYPARFSTFVSLLKG